jgi:hypothetical protein
MVQKREVVEALDLGDYVAEDETERLGQYFISTQQWIDVRKGEIDLVLGLKGSGKSAIFSLLSEQAEELAKQGTTIRLAENLEGDPVFSILLERTPQTEREWQGLWKLYFLSIAAGVLKETGADQEAIQKVLKTLQDEGLVAADMSPRSIIRRVIDYITSRLRFEGVEAGVHLNEETGAVKGLYAKILIARSDAPRFPTDSVIVDDLISTVNDCLREKKARIWLLLDRLDSVFKRAPDVEQKALRSLLNVYKDHFRNQPFRLKLFMRTEAFEQVLRRGFPEATHLTKKSYLIWTPKNTANLAVRRLANADAFLQFYGESRQELEAAFDQQKRLLNRVFERSMPHIRKDQFDRIIERLTDGQDHVSPRDLIMFLKFCREAEIERYQRGEPPVGDTTLFHQESLKQAFKKTSKAKLVESVLAEYPELTDNIQKLGKIPKVRVECSVLARIWGLPADEAMTLAVRLRDIGVLGSRGTEPVLFSVARVFWPELGISIAQ